MEGLLTKRMGKKRVIAETGAGQHGVATATMAAKFGLECEFIWARSRYAASVPTCSGWKSWAQKSMSLKTGKKTLKDASTPTFRDWAYSMETTTTPLARLAARILPRNGGVVSVDHRRRSQKADFGDNRKNFPTRFMPALAAVRIRLAYSRDFWG